jgi:hypothetical protein
MNLMFEPSLTPLTVEALGVEAPAADLSAPEPVEELAALLLCMLYIGSSSHLGLATWHDLHESQDAPHTICLHQSLTMTVACSGACQGLQEEEDLPD